MYKRSRYIEGMNVWWSARTIEFIKTCYSTLLVVDMWRVYRMSFMCTILKIYTEKYVFFFIFLVDVCQKGNEKKSEQRTNEPTNGLYVYCVLMLTVPILFFLLFFFLYFVFQFNNIFFLFLWYFSSHFVDLISSSIWWMICGVQFHGEVKLPCSIAVLCHQRNRNAHFLHFILCQVYGKCYAM